MAIVKAFSGFRPAPDLVEQVASPPYDVLNSKEARKMVENNPYSFLRIIKSEVDFDENFNQYDEAVYAKAKSNFKDFVSNKIFIQDDAPCFYLYRLNMNGHEQTGIVCAASIDDYWNDVIKKHEYTRPEKEQDRITHIRTTGIHSGPVFTAYRHHPAIDEVIEDFTKNEAPTYDFTAPDGIQHTLWVVNDVATVGLIEHVFATNIPETYIADGHHRAASSSKVGKMLREENPDFTGEESYNYFLSVLFPDNQLKIIDYNRVVKDLNGMTEMEFLEKLGDKFELTEEKTAFKPQKSYEFGMYMGKKWYKLQLKDVASVKSDAVGCLDIQVLSDEVFAPLLNIIDQRTDKRIDFVGGIRGLGELEKRVDSGEMVAAFSIFPVTMKQLFDVADSGTVMPPKTTWFEPKLRSGVVVHQFLD